MKLYKTKCTDCGSPIEQAGKRGMKPCPGCGKKWGFSVRVEGDGKQHIYLFRNGRRKQHPDLKKNKHAVTFSPHEIRLMRKRGYTPNKCARAGYEVMVLGIDK